MPTRRHGMLELTVRYLPTLTVGMSRIATEDFECEGKTIRAGDGLIVACAAANRDGTVFSNPTAFDMARDLRAEIGFGFGAHECLGRELALMLLEVAFSTLLARFPTLAPAAPIAELPFTRGPFLFGLAEASGCVREPASDRGMRVARASGSLHARTQRRLCRPRRLLKPRNPGVNMRQSARRWRLLGAAASLATVLHSRRDRLWGRHE